MRIRTIRLSNFRQHKSIEISLAGDRGDFAIVKGRNGAGKTNLLKGISWVITGQVALDETKFNPESLVSHSAITAAEVNDEITVYGAVELDLGSDGTAMIERQLFFTKVENGVRPAGSELAVNTMKKPQAGYQRETEPEIWIEKYLPRRFSHYFIFDGEHLNRFFRETEAKFVEQAVLEIASIDALGRMVDHLDSVSKDLLRASAQGQGAEAEENASNFDHYTRRFEEARQKLRDKQRLADDFREKIDEATLKLGDVRAIEADMQRRDTLSESAQSASQRGQDARAELAGWVTRNGPSLWLKDALETLSDAIQIAHANKVLPPPFSSESLRGLLKEAMCVCGRDLKSGGEACKHIEKVIEEFHTLSEVGLELSKLQIPLYNVVSNSKRAASELGSISDRIKQALSDEVSANEQFEILRKKLAGNDDEAVSLLSRNLDKYQDDFANTQQEIGRLETQEAHFASEVEKVRREIENQVTAGKKAQFAVAKAKFAKEALHVAQELYANLSDQVRAQVAQTLDEEFQSMIWKKDFFMPVEVDEHFRVQVRNKKGFEVREALSAGETACLAFAFSLTLSKVAGFFYPMVVDSPFGRLDAEVREFVSVVLARVLKSSADDSGNQLIMLMTDGEYTESVSQVMAESDPLLFELEFDLISGESTVLSLDK